MKKLFIVSVCALFTLTAFAQRTPVQRINPMIGTDKMGHTFPGACVPHGVVALSPDSDTIPHNIDGVYQPRSYEYCAGYQYKNKTIVGFSHTHLSGTGHSDLGDILFVPTTGPLKLNPGTDDDPDSGYRSRFSHDNETARAGYYSVVLDDYGVKAELTATQRTGMHRYTFPQNAETPRVLIDLDHGIYNYDGKSRWVNLRVEDEYTLTGFKLSNGWARTNFTYFAITFSKPITNYGYKDKVTPAYLGQLRKFDLTHNFPHIEGRQVVAWFEFDLAADPTLEIQVGISAVSTEGAMKNLKAEAEGKTFDQIAGEANRAWVWAMNVIEAEGTEDQLDMLYTSLYHTLINPSVYMDVDGNYRGLDQNIRNARESGFTNYTIFSFWDTYRALMPLYNIINRQRNRDMVASMLAHWEQSPHGMLPVWSLMANENFCMIGYHGVSVLADALVKGIPMDKEKALKALVSTSTVPYYVGTGEYMKYGWVPDEVNSASASITLEYAYDDWAIYNAAKALGRTDVAETYKKRAQNFRNVFDPSIGGFVRPRAADGTFRADFNLLETHDMGFIEGNSWNYSFYVPQDVNSLIEIMGGDKSFVNKLDSLFTMYLPDEFFEKTEDITREGIIGNYVHGNEVSQHIPYLYNWTSAPWKGQYWLREIMNSKYMNSIDGLSGNDDCGQMSAWYIFTAMGFYPVLPGSDQYVLGAPYLPYMKVNLEDGKSLVIRAPKVSDANRYVQRVTLNGKPATRAYLTHDEIMAGGELVFDMGSRPNKKRVFKGDQRPYSMN